MRNATILIIDDDVDFVNAVKAILENKNYTVITAVSRTEGMEKIRSEKPNLAILDVMITTWQDGFEMAREWKQDPELKKVPILMLTGVKNKTGIDFKSTAGDPVWLPVEVFLDKPVEPKLLLAKVEELL